MRRAETRLLESFLSCSDRFLEFGSGGSTVLAANAVSTSVVSVDSSLAWIDRVRAACDREGARVAPHLVHADIGPVRKWGYPVDPATDWTAYHSAVWSHDGAADADLYLVDGRFRVACFMQIVLRARRSAIIGVHDFASRPQYHVMNEVARETARADDLSFFVLQGQSKSKIRNILDKYSRVPQ